MYAKHSSHTYWSPSNTAHYLDRLTKPFPYLYTGKYTEAATGLVRMDARWYSPHNSRFVQPDYWNLRDTHLPGEVRHELMRFTGLDSGQLLDNPDQQMAYGYVSGNPLSWVDPFGLYLNPYHRNDLPEMTLVSTGTTLGRISDGLTVAGLAVGGPTNPVGAGLLGAGGVTGSVSLAVSSGSVISDFFDGTQFNETEAAGTANAMFKSIAESNIVNSFPSRYEVSIRTITTTYGISSGILFNEASLNESNSDTRFQKKDCNK